MSTEHELLFDRADRQLDKAQSEINAVRDTVQDLRTEVKAISKVTERPEPALGDEVDHQG